MALVLKISEGESPPWVRIPPLPPEFKVMKIIQKTVTREPVTSYLGIMDWVDEGIVFRWKLFGVTIWSKSYRHPYDEEI